jgi:regulator of PEP synthase PpsR (kinase-PPPase family)
MPEINPPEEIFQVERKRIFGLTISPSHLYEIRKERLRSMGLSAKADYASYDRILSELEYGENLMRKIGCPIIDVTNKATEETAALILEMYEKRNGR